VNHLGCAARAARAAETTEAVVGWLAQTTSIETLLGDKETWSSTGS
jgi:hypothetical protein